MIGFAFVSGCKTTTIIHHGCYGFFGKSFTFCGFASLLLCLISTSVVKLRMPLHLNFGVLILISNSSLNKSSCGTPLSASVFALECRGAVTCVAPPIEQPYCSADENRLYTSRCVMNCSAYDSSFERPLAVKPSSIIEWMLCQKSWLFIFDTVESLSNDAQKYNFFQIVAIGLFTP